MKIRPVEAVLFHAYRWTDGQTDMKKLIVASSDRAKALNETNEN
jgi:hypothetical protein